jgi:hypothetical protein
VNLTATEERSGAPAAAPLDRPRPRPTDKKPGKQYSQAQRDILGNMARMR